MMKRVLAATLCISPLLCLWVPTVSAAEAAGACGESLTWILDSDGTLTISGTGEMTDFPAAAPWVAYKMQIRSLSVAEITTFLWRSAGRPVSGGGNPFADVGAGAFYYDAVLRAVENGITNGTGSTTFSPEDTCTRAQIVTFLYRYLA